MCMWRSIRLPAPRILEALLEHLGAIWPSRLSLAGVPLGDTWRHPVIARTDATNGLVPIHKLSQWLAYSLIEPLQWSGIKVTDIDGFTGLAEYRNGGLLLDTGVLEVQGGVAPGEEVVIYHSNFYTNADKLTRNHGYLQDNDPVDVDWRRWTRRD